MKRMMLGLVVAAAMLGLCGCGKSSGEGAATPEQIAENLVKAVQKKDYEKVGMMFITNKEELEKYQTRTDEEKKMDKEFLEELFKHVHTEKIEIKVISLENDKGMVQLYERFNVPIRKVDGKWYLKLSFGN